MRDILVNVAIPSMDNWSAQFGMSLAMLVADFCMKPIVGAKSQAIKVSNKRGSILPQMRQELAEASVRMGATHTLFLDCDQAFPAHTLRQLLAAGKPVIGCNTVIKTFPSAPTARNFMEGEPHGKCVFTTPTRKRLERVWRVGTGVMLIETEIFLRMPKPWFMLRYVEDENRFVGEDWYFCEQLEKIGIRPYIDHEISWFLEHYGPVGFDHSMVPIKQIEESGKASNEGECLPLFGEGEGSLLAI